MSQDGRVSCVVCQSNATHAHFRCESHPVTNDAYELSRVRAALNGLVQHLKSPKGDDTIEEHFEYVAAMQEAESALSPNDLKSEFEALFKIRKATRQVLINWHSGRMGTCPESVHGAMVALDEAMSDWRDVKYPDVVALSSTYEGSKFKCERCSDKGYVRCGDNNTGMTYPCTEFGSCSFLGK